MQLKVKQQVLNDIENNPNLAREGSGVFLKETLNHMKRPTIRVLLSALKVMNEDDIAQSVEELLSKG